MSGSENSVEKQALMEAVLAHVPFDGFSEASLAAAARDCGIESEVVRAICPRGAIDLAAALHVAGDVAMAEAFAGADLAGLRYSEKVAEAIWLRLMAAGDREVVRRASTLFALPQHGAEGAALIWGTADAIWNVLGDTSEDANWYSKRAILSGVYGSVVLYWLGDDSVGAADSRAFIERRIGDVMAFEKFKAKFKEAPLTKPLAGMIDGMLGRVRKPGPRGAPGMPGRW